MITLRLSSLPPSTNNLFVSVPGKGRVKSQAYRSWIAAVGWDVALQKQQPIKGEIELEILVGRPDKRRRDVSNIIKGVEDLLVRHGLIEDDSLVRKLSVEWASISGCLVTAREVA